MLKIKRESQLFKLYETIQLFKLCDTDLSNVATETILTVYLFLQCS